nr:hypothetical protein [Tanacetum cinerariifolium]
MNQNFYKRNMFSNSISFDFDQSQPPQFPVIHQPPQEMSIQEMEDLKQQYLDEMKCLINSEYRDEIKIDKLKKNFNITPSLSTEEPDNSINQFEDFFDSNDESTLTGDDSFFIDNIKYVEASPPIFELVSSEDNPIPSSEFLTKSSSTSLHSFLEETNTFHNSLLEFENFYFDLGEISSGSTTTHSDISLHEYDSFIFNLAHEEFVDELAHIISPPEYDRFYFRDLPDQ